jgi:hypothetical protein
MSSARISLLPIHANQELYISSYISILVAVPEFLRDGTPVIGSSGDSVKDKRKRAEGGQRTRSRLSSSCIYGYEFQNPGTLAAREIPTRDVPPPEPVIWPDHEAMKQDLLFRSHSPEPKGKTLWKVKSFVCRNNIPCSRGSFHSPTVNPLWQVLILKLNY